MHPKSDTPYFVPTQNQKAMNNNRISTTRNGNTTTQACAACKYQRRKCAPDCILAPYFPHDRQRQFLNAHKLFGVSNITKIIKFLTPHDKDQAMRTIIYQSDMRASDPVGGCYRYILDLQAQIDFYRAELELVLQQLAIFRAQQAHHALYAPPPNNLNVPLNADGEVLNADPLGFYTHHQHYHPQQDHFLIMHQNAHPNPLHFHHEQINSWPLHNSTVSLCSNLTDDYDHKPVIDIDSDERSELGFESDDLVHRSDEAVLFKIDDAVIKAEADCMQQAQDHDLKGAATSFTLTNCTC